MINRLPKEFRLPAPNGVKNGASRLPDDDGFAQRIVRSTARCIGHYPVVALGAAFVVGLITGRIVKR